MEGDSSPMSSMCMVRAEELYPKIAMVKEDEKIKAPMTECMCVIFYMFCVFNCLKNKYLMIFLYFSGWRIG